MTRSVAPVSVSTYSTLVQVRPASVVLKTPRSALAFHRFPSAATYATLGSLGCASTREMARVSTSPRWVQCCPPSTER